GFDVVEAVDAGDTVADRQHLPDLGDFGFLAEVLDLLLEDCRNLGGADVHQRASFIANLIALSLVRREESTMRLPSLTTSPPMIAGSTLTSIWTSCLVTDFSASLSAVRWASDSFSATVTCAVTSPLWCATRARYALTMSRTANRRRLCATSCRKLAASPEMPAGCRPAPAALLCWSAVNTGLRTRRGRSLLSASIVSNRSRSPRTASIAFCSSASSNSAVA